MAPCDLPFPRSSLAGHQVTPLSPVSRAGRRRTLWSTAGQGLGAGVAGGPQACRTGEAGGLGKERCLQ